MTPMSPMSSTVAASCSGTLSLPAAYSQAAPGLVTNGFTGGSDTSSIVNELLVQMQSFDRLTGGQRLLGKLIDKVNLMLPLGRQLRSPQAVVPNILIIAATNRASSLDPALLRPGRFDRKIGFELPAKSARRELLDYFLSTKAHKEELDDERRDALAATTIGYSPAMLENLLDEALVFAVRRGDKAMTWADVEHARMTIEVGVGQPVEYTDHERRLIATHEAGHATMAYLTAPDRRLEILTIIKRKGSLGLLAHGDKHDVYTRSRSEMEALIQIAMGGQCAEEIFFGDVSTGPGGDLLYATNCAAEMVGAHGMEKSLVSYLAVQNSAFSDTNIVGRVLADPEGRQAVEDVLQKHKQRARELLTENRHLVEALRDALLARHELLGGEITEVLETARATPRTIDLRAQDQVSS
jgi:ATP-dependent Zn protease